MVTIESAIDAINLARKWRPFVGCNGFDGRPRGVRKAIPHEPCAECESACRALQDIDHELDGAVYCINIAAGNARHRRSQLIRAIASVHSAARRASYFGPEKNDVQRAADTVRAFAEAML